MPNLQLRHDQGGAIQKLIVNDHHDGDNDNINDKDRQHGAQPPKLFPLTLHGFRDGVHRLPCVDTIRAKAGFEWL